GGPLISHEPGSATAHLDTYAVVHQLDKVDGSGGDATLGVRYLDDVVQRGGRWVIRHRQARILWHRASAGSAGQPASLFRSSRPDVRAVASPSTMVTSPLTTVALKPTDRCDRRFPPAGRSFTILGTAGPTTPGSNTLRSATMPSRSRPRSENPHARAGA